MALQPIVKGVLDLAKQPVLGTTDSDVADILMPAVKSAFHVFITRYPDPNLVNWESLRVAVTHLIKSVTLPSLTLGTVESVNGFSGTSKAFAFSTVEDSKEMSMSFNENVEQIVYNTFKQYIYGIRDPHTGLSTVSNYTARNLSFDLMIVTSKPVMYDETVENSIANMIDHAIWIKGAAPINLPTDAVMSHSKDDSSKVELEFQFKYREMVDNDYTAIAAIDLLEDRMVYGGNENDGAYVKPQSEVVLKTDSF